MNMILSTNGENLIKSFEGFSLKEYPDNRGIPTIGWGCTHGVTKGMVLTQAQAEARFKADTQAAVDAVNRLVHITLNQNQFDALVSFTFNTGAGALASSTLLKMINARNEAGIGPAWLEWDKVEIAGKFEVSPGLSARRQKELLVWRLPCKTA